MQAVVRPNWFVNSFFTAGKQKTQRHPLDLNKEVEKARDILERTIPKMVEIQLHTDKDLWQISADPVQIEQIFLNLGTNAADAMPGWRRSDHQKLEIWF